MRSRVIEKNEGYVLLPKISKKREAAYKALRACGWNTSAEAVRDGTARLGFLAHELRQDIADNPDDCENEREALTAIEALRKNERKA